MKTIFNTMQDCRHADTKTVDCSLCPFSTKFCFTEGRCPLADEVVDALEKESGKELELLEEVTEYNRSKFIGYEEKYFTRNNVPCPSKTAYHRVVNIYAGRGEIPANFVSKAINKFMQEKQLGQG